MSGKRRRAEDAPRQALTRRSLLALGALAGAATIRPPAVPALAATSDLTFNELYSKIGVLGMEFSDRVKSLSGQRVRMRGFMAPPLKADAKFFVLTEIPTALCPFCSSDADWPDNIVVVYLDARQDFVQFNALIAAEGMLQYGSWRDPETGFLSLLRLGQARFAVA